MPDLRSHFGSNHFASRFFCNHPSQQFALDQAWYQFEHMDLYGSAAPAAASGMESDSSDAVGSAPSTPSSGLNDMMHHMHIGVGQGVDIVDELALALVPVQQAHANEDELTGCSTNSAISTRSRNISKPKTDMTNKLFLSCMCCSAT